MIARVVSRSWSSVPDKIHEPEPHVVALTEAGIETELNDPALHIVQVSLRKFPHAPGSPVALPFNNTPPISAVPYRSSMGWTAMRTDLLLWDRVFHDQKGKRNVE